MVFIEEIRVRLFGKFQIRIFDPRSLGPWCVKGTDESTLAKDLSVTLMHHDQSDFGSKIGTWIFPKKHTLSFHSCPNKTNFHVHVKSFTLSLTFEMLFKATWKWLIA